MAVRSAFATKSRFEILNEEGVDDVESEEEEVVEEQSQEHTKGWAVADISVGLPRLMTCA